MGQEDSFIVNAQIAFLIEKSSPRITRSFSETAAFLEKVPKHWKHGNAKDDENKYKPV